MSTKLLIRPKAIQDLTAHAFYIAEDAPEESGRFLEDAESSFRLLVEIPEIGSPRMLASPHLKGLRIWPVRNHPRHLIFYLAKDEHVEIIRILHSRRDLPTTLRE